MKEKRRMEREQKQREKLAIKKEEKSQAVLKSIKHIFLAVHICIVLD